MGIFWPQKDAIKRRPIILIWLGRIVHYWFVLVAVVKLVMLGVLIAEPKGELHGAFGLLLIPVASYFIGRGLRRLIGGE